MDGCVGASLKIVIVVVVVVVVTTPASLLPVNFVVLTSGELLKVNTRQLSLQSRLHLLSTASGCFFLLLQIFLLLFRQLLLLLLTAFTPSRAHVVLLLVLFVVLLVVLLLSATCFPCVPPGPRRNKLLCKEVLLPRKHLARPFDGPEPSKLGFGK